MWILKKIKNNKILFILVSLFLLGGSVPIKIFALVPGYSTLSTIQQTSQDNRDEKEMQRAANKIFRSGVSYFNKGEYWKCAQELIIVMDFYPKFKKLDQVITYLGNCLFQEELYTASIRMFNYLIKKYPHSDRIPEALLGLEKAYYNQRKYKQTLRVYYVILKKTNDKKILSEACYWAGQSHHLLKNYDMAINVLKKIDSHSDYYDVALYTTALSYLKKSNVAISVDYFRKITALPLISAERRKVVDDARLTLGLIYYQLNAFKASIQQLSKISDKHENYQDALLGMGWAYLKLNDYDAVIKVLDKLIKLYPNSENAEEAYFLLGQAYIAIGNYDKAITAYKTIVDLYPDRQHVPSLIKKVNNRLRVQENRIEDLKVKILIEETRLLDAIPLNGNKDVPKYLIKEKKRLREIREQMIKNLLAERDQLLYMQDKINKLTKLAERRERRKNWRGYAEYGISRALFLKELGKSRGN